MNPNSAKRRRRRKVVLRERETFLPPVCEIHITRDTALVLIHELADALRAPTGLVHADVRTTDGKRLLVSIREGG